MVYRLARLMLVADIAIASIALVVLHSPLPVLITFGSIYLASFFVTRGHDRPLFR